MDELPRGIKIVSDPNMKPGTMELRQGNKVVARVENIQCPVVQDYIKRGRPEVVEGWTVERLAPDRTLGLVFTPGVKVADVEKFHILSTIEHCQGNLSRAARMLNIGKATIYKKMREWKSEKK